jgi:ATP-dependent helicase/nuclease subunit B
MPPRLYTISAHRPFLATLAEGLRQMAGGDPLLLARVTVLLPTRRAVRGLREAFLRATMTGDEPGAPLLLPRMRPIGDLDGDELAFFEGIFPGDADAVPPAIADLRRRLLLTRLVLEWGGRRSQSPPLPGQAAALAATLARLIDTVATQGGDFANLADLVPADLAEHWQTVLQFLELLPRFWPGILAAEGALDPAERRNRLLLRQAALWRVTPPADPVIAAGLVGGIPAMTELLAVVAALPNGAVILPGLDRGRSASEWAAIEADEAHPQYLIAGLLRDLQLDPAEVREWPEGTPAADVASPRVVRTRLVAEALRPAMTTDAWRQLPPLDGAALGGVGRIDCTGSQQEAIAIALALRRQLDKPGKTAALVTPDRGLARRVAAELRRWGIDIDDSAGVPMARTPPGVFLRLVLDLAENRLAPVPLLAALKHPLAAGGLAPAAFRDLARRLEQGIRGPRPAPGFAGLHAAIPAEEHALHRFVDRLRACLGALCDLLATDGAPLERLATAHIEAAERLAATNEDNGAARLWDGDAGEAAAGFCHDLIAAAGDFPLLQGRHYPALFEALAAGMVVRPAFGRHPRLAIWGLVEARLQQADLVVLGGLNEGVWPGPPEHDPWMSRQMRRDFGLALPERAVGMAAHDFAQAMAAPEVVLTRAARQEGVPTVPSRWLLRLDAVLRAVGLEGMLDRAASVVGIAEMLDATPYEPPSPAAPRPPLSARPRSLSVTQIETWLRDPYAIYARHILGLKALDELDADPGRAELGTTVHEILEDFFRRHPEHLPDDAEAELLTIGREHFGPLLSRPGAWAFWWPRFVRMTAWLTATEREHRPLVAESLSECEGKLIIEAPGGPFTVTAIADRIDRFREGGYLLVDYKTGSPPSKKAIKAGYAPQLPLEGAILRAGSFGGVTGNPAALEHWRLSGGEPAGERCPLTDDDPAELIDYLLARTTALIARFDDPATPYLAAPFPQWQPRFSDYRHLERLAAAEEDEE